MALIGKVALVTGASRGIGRAIAQRLAGDGALVAIHYGSNASAAAETLRTITDAGGKAFVIEGRLNRSETEIGGMFAVLDERLVELTGQSRFDILVNNAGVDRFGSIEQITPEIFEEVFNTNVKGPFFLTQRAIPRIRDGGRIINLSSGLVRTAVPRHTVYTMTKGAIDKLTMILAQQLGARGITVNSVAPGAVDTDMTASWLRDNADAAAEISSITALGRVGQTQDIADVVAFLASDQARWVTGNWIDATGGQH
jgi:NAD(P)-dependent dehydrogenase (short-subunit alcohol dehydrogenase family)